MAAPIEDRDTVIELRVVSGDSEIKVAPEEPSGGGELPNFGADYETKELLSKDGYGELYRAHNQGLDQDVCIRLIPTEMLPTDDARKCFLRFCRRYVTVHHEAMVPLYSFHEDERGVWFVMENTQSPSLEDLFNQSDFKSTDKIADVFEQLAESMQALHQVGIRFGAISAAGILVDKSGSGHKVLLRDWWAYALLQAQEGKPDPAALPYASPEQLQGDGKLDERSDIYTFGAMLFEALTGKTPYQDKDQLKLAIKIISGAMPEVDGPFADTAFAKVVTNCLQKNAADRYESTEQLLKDLRSAAKGAPVPALQTNLSKTHNLSSKAAFIVAITSVLLVIGFVNFYRYALSDVASNYSEIQPPISADLATEAMNAENRNDLEEAKSLWAMAVAENPNDTWNQVNLGRLQGMTGEYEAGLRTLGHAAAMEPGQPEAWYQMGRLKQRLGQPKDAAAAYRKAIEADPDNSMYYSDLAIAYVDGGKFKKAIEAAEKSVNLDPTSYDTQFNLGVAYYAADKIAEAKQAFEAAKVIYPEGPAVWTNLSLVYSRLGEHEKAIHAALEATQMDPTQVEFVRNLAHTYANSGDLPRALSEYKRALHMDRFDAGTWAGIADTYERMGKMKEAREAKKHFTE